jgi:hypothetical protein
MEERCYLQLPGCYDDAQSFPRGKEGVALKPADSEDEIPF